MPVPRTYRLLLKTLSFEIVHPILHHKLSIINVYYELGTNTLLDLRQIMTTLATKYEIIVLRDFNLYYPLWSTTYRYNSQSVTSS